MANISPAGSKALVKSPARRILWALIGRELPVNELAAEAGELPASVSQHLAKLRMTRLVQTRREGTQVFYRLENEHVAQLVTDAIHNAEHSGPASRATTWPTPTWCACTARQRAPEMGHQHHDHERPHVHHEHRGGLRGWVTGLFHPHSHDSADAVDPALESSAQGIRAVQTSLVALAVTAALQMAVVAVSGSVALFADTVHNLSDAPTAVPLWIAFVVGRRAADRRYTYGYGRAEDLAGLFIVAMITLSAVLAGVQAVRRLVDPAPVEHLGWVALAGLIGFAGNELVAVHRIRVGRAIGSTALVADGLHARTDGLTSLAVLAGAGGVAAGFPLADPFVGLVITVAILAVLRTAVRDVYRRLMDAVDPALVDLAEQSLSATPGVTAVRAVRMRWIGHALHAEADLDIDGGVSVTDAHALAHDAEHQLTHDVPGLRSAVIHAYPAARHEVATP